MGNLYEELLLEEKSLKELIAVTTESIDKAPDGKLTISYSRGNVQYYYRERKDIAEKPHLTHGIYIKKSELQLAHDLAQRDYDLAVRKAAESKLQDVQTLLEYYDESHKIENIYESLRPCRKEIVKPRVVSDEEYIKNWQEKSYTRKSFEEGTAIITSDRGERVRSKSEKIIADMLQKNGLPYRYEEPISVCGMGIIHPDFTVLNIKQRKEIYWEHLGLMDDKVYCENALRKIEAYQRSNIILGDRLIITYETSRYPLETAAIERNIKAYCLS